MSQDEHVPDVPILASPLPGEDVADIDGPDQDVDQTATALQDYWTPILK